MRSVPPPTPAELEYGVPCFLDQLVDASGVMVTGDEGAPGAGGRLPIWTEPQKAPDSQDQVTLPVVKAAGSKVSGIPFPEADQAVNDYPIAGCAKAPNPAGAQAFVDYVLSDKGKAVLTEAGFVTP